MSAFRFPGSLTRRDAIACALLLLSWALAAVLVNWSGDFANNDDFAYALSVRWLLEDGEFRRTTWTYVPSLTNVLVGALFALRDGPFFESLRLSTLSAGAIGLLGTYALARQAGARIGTAAFAAFVLASNPVYFDLSYTFMTDVHYAAWIVWGLVWLQEALRQPRLPILIAGTLCAVAATLTRQAGLALPLAFAAASVLRHPKSFAHWFQALFAMSVAVGAYATFQATAASSPDVYNPAVIAEHMRNNFPVYHAIKHGLIALIYLGAFLLPVVWLAVRWREIPRIAPFVLLACGALAVVGVAALGLPALPGINILRNLGLGSLDLVGAGDLPRAPELWWRVWSLAGAVSGSAVLILLAPRPKELLYREPGPLFLTLYVALHLCLHLVRAPFFDRYLVTVLPPLLALLLSGAPDRISRSSRALAVATALGWAAFAVAGTHDDLARNRAAWSLARVAEERGVDPLRVDAGFPHKGWQHFVRSASGPALPPDKWAEPAEWVVSLAPREPASALHSVRYRRWLPPGDEVMRLVPAPVSTSQSGASDRPSLNAR
jgi:hypothetical protein